MSLEIITRYERKKPTSYSFDGGKTFVGKREFKQQINKAKKENQ